MRDGDVLEPEAPQGDQRHTFRCVAPALVRGGWSPLPVRGKSPDLAGAGWQRWNREVPSPDLLAFWARRHPDANVGIAVGPSTVVVDADVLDPSLAGALSAACDGVLGRTPLVRIGRAPKWLRVYRGRVRHEKPHPIELFCGHGQFVAFGTHPDTRQPYTWPHLDPMRVSVDDARVPIVEQDAVDAFLADAERILGVSLRRRREPVPRDHAPVGSWRDGLLGRAFELSRDVHFQVNSSTAAVRCPWDDEHSFPGRGSRSASVVFAPTDGQRVGFFHCSHAHCAHLRTPGDVLRALPAWAVEDARAALGLDAEADEEFSRFVVEGVRRALA